MRPSFHPVHRSFKEVANANAFNAGGRVVFLSSAVTKFSGVGPSSVLYTASKGAVEQLTRVLAKDLGARGMTVNAVAPGATETTLFRKGRTQEFVDFVASLHPLKRIAEPDEIAPIVAFLAGEEAGWVNGQTIFVNGVRGCFAMGARGSDRLHAGICCLKVI